MDGETEGDMLINCFPKQPMVSLSDIYEVSLTRGNG